MSNIIFLDFDGVINNDSTFHMDTTHINPYCIDIVAEVAEICKLKVVVISSWRNAGYDFVKDRFTKEGFSDFLNLFHDDWRIDPDSSNNESRGNLVRKWLKEHIVEKYVILDDEISQYDSDMNVLGVNPEIGLTLCHAIMMKSYFSCCSTYIQFVRENFSRIEKILKNNMEFFEKNELEK